MPIEITTLLELIPREADQKKEVLRRLPHDLRQKDRKAPTKRRRTAKPKTETTPDGTAPKEVSRLQEKKGRAGDGEKTSSSKARISVTPARRKQSDGVARTCLHRAENDRTHEKDEVHTSTEPPKIPTAPRKGRVQ